MNKILYLSIIGLIFFLDSGHITASSVSLTSSIEQSAYEFSNLAYPINSNHPSKSEPNIPLLISDHISLIDDLNYPVAWINNQENAFNWSATGVTEGLINELPLFSFKNPNWVPEQSYFSILPNAGDFSKFYLYELDAAENFIYTTMEEIDHLTHSMLLIPAVILLLCASLLSLIAFPNKLRTQTVYG